MTIIETRRYAGGKSFPVGPGFTVASIKCTWVVTTESREDKVVCPSCGSGEMETIGGSRKEHYSDSGYEEIFSWQEAHGVCYPNMWELCVAFCRDNHRDVSKYSHLAPDNGNVFTNSKEKK